MTISPLLFAPLPFLLWAAVRFGQAGLGVVLCFTTLFRYFAGAHPGQGFATPPDAIVATQLTLIAMSLPLVVLSALLAERRRSEEALRRATRATASRPSPDRSGCGTGTSLTNAVYVDPSLKSLLGFAEHEIGDHVDDWRLAHAARRLGEADGDGAGPHGRARGDVRGPASHVAPGWQRPLFPRPRGRRRTRGRPGDPDARDYDRYHCAEGGGAGARGGARRS